MLNYNFEISFEQLREDIRMAILGNSTPENVNFFSENGVDVFILSSEGELEYAKTNKNLLDRTQVAVSNALYIAVDSTGFDIYQLIKGKVPLHNHSVSFVHQDGLIVFKGNEIYTGGSNYSEMLLTFKVHACNTAGQALLVQDKEDWGKSLKTATEDIYKFAEEKGLSVLGQDAFTKDKYGRQSRLQGYQLMNGKKPIGDVLVPAKIYEDKKTPEYTLRAQRNYAKKVSKRSVVLNKDNDAELIEAIDNDNEPFNQLVKRLLNEYYKIS